MMMIPDKIDCLAVSLFVICSSHVWFRHKHHIFTSALLFFIAFVLVQYVVLDDTESLASKVVFTPMPSFCDSTTSFDPYTKKCIKKSEDSRYQKIIVPLGA